MNSSLGNLIPPSSGAKPGLTPSAQGMRFVTSAFPTGVALVACQSGGQPMGLLANSFTSVSLDPPLVSVNIARTSTSWPLLKSSARLGISILSADQEQAYRQLVRNSAERFTGIDWFSPGDGSLLLHGASATFTVSLADELEAGDHTVVLLRVLDLHRYPEREPLVFYSSLITRLAMAADEQRQSTQRRAP